MQKAPPRFRGEVSRSDGGEWKAGIVGAIASHKLMQSKAKYLLPRFERFFTSFKMTRYAVCHTERNAVK